MINRKCPSVLNCNNFGRIEQHLEGKVSVDERANRPFDGRPPVQAMSKPTQVKSYKSLRGVNGHAEEEEPFDVGPELDGDVVQEPSDGA